MAERAPIGLRFRQMVDDEVKADNGRLAYRSLGRQTPGRDFSEREAIWLHSSLREVNTLEAKRILGISNPLPPSVLSGPDLLQGFEIDGVSFVE